MAIIATTHSRNAINGKVYERVIFGYGIVGKYFSELVSCECVLSDVISTRYASFAIAKCLSPANDSLHHVPFAVPLVLGLFGVRKPHWLRPQYTDNYQSINGNKIADPRVKPSFTWKQHELVSAEKWKKRQNTRKIPCSQDTFQPKCNVCRIQRHSFYVWHSQPMESHW